MKLKPCPFCGDTNPTRTWLGHVYCRFCGAEGPIATDGPEVTWNTRHKPRAKPKKKPTRRKVCGSTSLKVARLTNEAYLTLLDEIDSLADFVADSLELRIEDTNILQRLNAMANDMKQAPVGKPAGRLKWTKTNAKTV